MSEIRVGIIGLQHLHPPGYLPLFRETPGVRVVAAADGDEALRSRFCEEAGIEAHARWEDLARRDDVDAVLIFLPHADCRRAGIRAAEAGKHVVVEKPGAADAESVRWMIRAAAKNGVILSMPYVWRYNVVAREMKRLIDAGALGEVVALEGRCAAGPPQRYVAGNSSWMLEKAKSGGGPMHNLGVHWIDLFRWLLRDEVRSAAGEVSHRGHGLEIEDNSFAILTFEGGAVATLDISYGVPASYPAGRDLYIGIRGTKGVLVWSPNWSETTSASEENELMLCSEAPEHRDRPAQRIRLTAPKVAGYGGAAGAAYLNDVFEAVRERRQPGVTGVDGLRALEVVEAVYRSAETGRREGVQRIDEETKRMDA
ncbi:MAG: hypothetical protein A3F84_03180 [Candidatus Handelsmanbacteria bacterium RIFCSPLOWO2_12_FULL_64_10]|uniref:Oxidoreductase n=1 Tax=Handelsmanbacteria sp. (strain RIFCSPLOWO2_12_FULL_64_10) TaxID=1817868 RepID=A0A1F6C6L5_HANXR|nr:MAG: hypothetical protein A3F84_03180 [Candidatus Handelsmanbacteria bacterium RIFCSPLOWO2_12_FULL_64_10]